MNRSSHFTIFLLFAIAYFMSYFLRSANAVIAGDLSRDLALNAADLGLMTSLFYAAFALAQLPLGEGLDRWGPRFVTSGLMLTSVVGCLLFASAQSFLPLAVGRALIGMGMGGVLMGTLKAFASWYPPQRVATVSGIFVGLGASGGLMAATPLALLNQAFGWRAIFYGSALVVFGAAVGIALGVRNTPEGVKLPVAQRGEGNLGTIFRDMRFWRIVPFNFFLLGTTQAVQTLWGGPYLFDVLGLEQLATGNVLLAMGIGLVAGYLACGLISDRFGFGPAMLGSGLLFLLCQAGMLIGGRLPVPLVALIFGAFSFAGAFNIVLLAQARACFPPYLGGRAITAVNLFGFGGTALIQWWMGLIINAFPTLAPGRYPPAAYNAALIFTLVCTTLCIAWYLPLVGKRVRVEGTSRA